ncbi:MAG TPA: tripartite tricarboxylate transporter substrate binding protein [Hyphomicrobiaceae bacterium]|nr:tripartite tricarboxylate transporter substrate binding protein [Hyphomicrobiaceae bacterium]
MGTLMIDRRSVLLAGACSLLAPPALAQRLSERTITIVVPFTPGTGIDILARLLGEQIQKRWEQTVIIENKPGASGNIGSQQAARAEPDGHTLLMTVNTFVMNASLFKSLPYDPQKSFAPIIEVATGSLALVVHPSLAAATVSEFVAYAKARPDEINYASPGRGTPQHLAMELLKLNAGISLKHVPYSGSAGAVRDLVGGHVNAMFLPLHTALPLVADNQIRLLAVGSAARSAQAPDVQTLAEQGVSGFDVDLWYGLLAPAGTSPEIVARYNGVLNEILAQASVREALAKQGMDVKGGPPARLAELIANDQPRWSKVVKDAGITPE